MKDKITNEMPIIDKFIYKLFIAVLVLTIMVGLDLLNIVQVKSVQSKLSTHFNVLKVIETINGEIPIIPLEIDTDYVVDSSNFDSEIVDGKLRVKSSGMVKCYYPGVVVKIEKDNKYSVHILGANNYLYIYEGLDTIDCKIYQYIDGNESFASAKSYFISVYHKEKLVEFNE